MISQNTTNIVKSLEPIVVGKPLNDVVDALLATATKLVQMGGYPEEVFIGRAHEIWKMFKDVPR